MRKSFIYKILILVIGCCFTLAATETDLGSFHQTFFDDCDTYVPATEEHLYENVAFEKQHPDIGLALFTWHVFNTYLAALESPVISDNHHSSIITSNRKIFLLASVWRI